MKIKIFLSMLLLAVMFTAKLNADNCTPLCSGDWIDPYAQTPPELAYIVESGQVWKINYKYRECDNGMGGTYKEIKLESLTLLSGTATGTTQALMLKAAKKLLWMSPDLFTNATGSGGWDVRISTDCCWKTHQTVINNVTHETREMCTTQTCCKYTYHVQPVSNGSFEVTSTTAGTSNCTLPSDCAGASGCNNICGYGYIPSNTNITPEGNACNPCEDTFIPNPNNKVEFTNVNSSKIKAYYSYLTCNDTLYVTLTEIDYTSGIVDPDDIKTAIGKSIKAAVLANTWLPSNCTIKVMLPTCWKTLLPGENATKPCDYTTCCTFFYNISISGTSVTVNSSSVIGNTILCTTYDDCFNLCNEDYQVGDGLLTKFGNKTIETEFNLNDKLLVKPNPTTGLSTIEIESESMGKLTLKLLDMQGREVQKIERLKSGKALSLQLDGTNLAQGTYTLQLVIENQIIATSNLIIQK